jgi:hypothetical protein
VGTLGRRIHFSHRISKEMLNSIGECQGAREVARMRDAEEGIERRDMTDPVIAARSHGSIDENS